MSKNNVLYIHGGPTTGKTTLQAVLAESGIRVIDSDDIIRATFGFPTWHELAPGDKAAGTKMVAAAIQATVDHIPRKVVVFTNIWSMIGDMGASRFAYSAFRRDAGFANNLFIRRANPANLTPERLARLTIDPAKWDDWYQNWLANVKADVIETFDNGDYLGTSPALNRIIAAFAAK